MLSDFDCKLAWVLSNFLLAHSVTWLLYNFCLVQLFIFISCVLTWAAFNKIPCHLFFTVTEAGSSRSRSGTVWFLVRTLASLRWLSSCSVLTWQRHQFLSLPLIQPLMPSLGLASWPHLTLITSQGPISKYYKVDCRAIAHDFLGYIVKTVTGWDCHFVYTF